jgi:hypothetical protein
MCSRIRRVDLIPDSRGPRRLGLAPGGRPPGAGSRRRRATWDGMAPAGTNLPECRGTPRPEQESSSAQAASTDRTPFPPILDGRPPREMSPGNLEARGCIHAGEVEMLLS